MTVKPKATTILIVDDEIDLLDILSIALDDAGYACLTATTAVEALRLLDQTPTIDVVISDVRMPEMDGLTLLKTIRERLLERSWLQVLFITGHASLDTAITALRLDAVDFLHKPVRRTELLSAVQRAVAKASGQRKRLQAWREGQSQLARLSEDVQRVTEMLAMFPANPITTPAIVANDLPAPSNIAHVPPSRRRLLELLRLRETRQHFFDDKLFADPVLHMLLDLMEHRLQNRQISVTSLCQTSGIPITTAIRRLDDLEKLGFILRWDDPKDGRRQLVKLTQKAAEKLTAYLFAIDRQLR